MIEIVNRMHDAADECYEAARSVLSASVGPLTKRCGGMAVLDFPSPPNLANSAAQLAKETIEVAAIHAAV
jgi:hypothetical protein